MDSYPNSETNPRFQKIDKASLLSLCPLFSGLSQWELKSISQLMRLVEYHKNEIIYREGAESESFYVVVSGRFEASVSSLNKKKVLAYLRRGDYFGETSLLTNESHSKTVRALSDSLLLVLKKEDFKKTIEHNATVSLEISRRLSSRLSGREPRSRSLLKSDVISVFSNFYREDQAEFSINLASSLFQETHQKTILIDMDAPGSENSPKRHLSKKYPLAQFSNIESSPQNPLKNLLTAHPVGFDILNITHQEKESGEDEIISSLLNYLAIDYRFILVNLPGYLDEAIIKSFSQSEFIFFVTDSNINNVTEIKDVSSDIQKNLSFPEEKISIVIHEAVFGIRTTTSARREIFGKKLCYSLPAIQGSAEPEIPRSMPLVVSDPDIEYSRVVRHIARRVSNNLVGIALGSGAALGLAHIGVLKVLEREKIPVDIIAGSSIGALVGSLYAVGMNSKEVEEAAFEINSIRKLLRLMDISLFPIRGLLYGKKVIRHLKKHLGNKTFDDCHIPFKVVGADLSTRQAITIDSGYVADAVRISIAIPAIFRPIFVHGNIVVDGGILNPLPIKALHQAGANKVIAVNVFPTPKDMLERRIVEEEALEKEALQMRQKNFIIRGMFRLKKFFLRRFFPNIFDILMNTIQAMETEIAEVEGESADVLIRPVVPTANWVDFFKAQQFIKRGEEEAMKMLPKIKDLVTQQNV